MMQQAMSVLEQTSPILLVLFLSAAAIMLTIWSDSDVYSEKDG